MKPPPWLIGSAVAMATLLIVGMQLALFASGGGLLLAMMIAFWAGAGASALAGSRHAGRDAAIVGASIVFVLVAYLVAVQNRPLPPGTSQGGPSIPKPP